jgi:hypothetical protein
MLLMYAAYGFTKTLDVKDLYKFKPCNMLYNTSIEYSTPL